MLHQLIPGQLWPAWGILRQDLSAIFNICFCDYGTILVDKNKT